MTPSRAANLSLALVAVGWVASVFGAFSQLGDPPPWMPMSEVEIRRRVSMVVLFFGLFALIGSLWLSGYAFGTAKRRSLIAMLGCALPLLVMFVYVIR